MKKLITMLLAVGLIATAAIGSTLATEAAREDLSIQINNSKGFNIVQNIQQSDGNAVEFTGPLFPAVYQGELPAVKDGYYDSVGNAVDYLVSVTREQSAGNISAADAAGNSGVNSGTEDVVYVRTLFAFQDTNNIVDKMHFNVNENVNEVTWQEVDGVKIDGIDYRLFVCDYTNAIKSGETTPVSMKQFCFDKGVTNEDFNFGQYKIMVKSWAVSSKDVFDTTEITKDVHPWVTSVAENTLK